MPINSMKTLTGNTFDTSAWKSHAPLPATASTNSAAHSRIRGSSALIALGPNIGIIARR